jgi:t-SNARE complex subunit (syntaxin)
MSQERIVELLDEIRGLLASQVKLITEIQQRNAESEEYTRALVEKRAKEMRATSVRDFIVIGIMLVTIALLVVFLAHKGLIR